MLPWAATNGNALAPWDPAVLLEPCAGQLCMRAGACYAGLGVCDRLARPQPARRPHVRDRVVHCRRENALAILVPNVSRYLPGGALSGVDTHGLHLLPLYTAVPLLAAWVLAISTLALRTTLRRDIA